MSEYLAENARLRQLSRRHAEGQLSLEDYRAGRREILTALEAGEGEAPAAQPLPSPAAWEAEDDGRGVEPQDEAATPDEPAASAGEVTAGWDSPTRVLAMVLGVSLLLAVSALVYVFAL